MRYLSKNSNIFRKLSSFFKAVFPVWHGDCKHHYVLNLSETKIMRDILLLNLRDKNPVFLEGGGQSMPIGWVTHLTETFNFNSIVASVWHEYCSDAVCPTLMDWQAR